MHIFENLFSIYKSWPFMKHRKRCVECPWKVFLYEQEWLTSFCMSKSNSILDTEYCGNSPWRQTTTRWTVQQLHGLIGNKSVRADKMTSYSSIEVLKNQDFDSSGSRSRLSGNHAAPLLQKPACSTGLRPNVCWNDLPDQPPCVPRSGWLLDWFVIKILC